MIWYEQREEDAAPALASGRHHKLGAASRGLYIHFTLHTYCLASSVQAFESVLLLRRLPPVLHFQELHQP